MKNNSNFTLNPISYSSSHTFYFKRGQALITLLFFMIVAITITSTAVAVTIINSQSTSIYDQANSAYYIAEAGAENALLRLLRDPSYTGETLNVDSGTATVSVTGTSPITIISAGKIANSFRKIQVQVQYNNNVLSIVSWKEIL